MAQVDGTVEAFAATGTGQATPDFSDKINVVYPDPLNPHLGIDWTPRLGTFSYVVGSDTIVPTVGYDSNGDPILETYTATDTLITFTATVTIYDENQAINEYIWDFGDGTTGFGQTTTHTFKTPNKHSQIVLCVVDNFNRRFYVRKAIYLTTAEGLYSMGTYGGGSYGSLA